jgi:hypothetical protein
LRTKGTVTIQSINEAIKCTGDLNAALRVYGGVSIQKNMYICDDIVISSGGIQVAGIGTFQSNLTVAGTSTLNGEVTVNTGIVPDVDEGAYLGSSIKPWSEAHIDEIRIGVSGDTEIDTATGGLTLDSAGGTTTVDDNLVVTGNLDVDGTTQLDGLNVDGNTTLDNTTINGTLSVSGSATIDQVTIDGSTVTATRFAGTADVANEVPVYGTDGRGFTNHDMSLMMNPSQVGSGQVQQLMRDQNIRFNTGASELKCDGDIAAFASDDRLKTNKVGISNALDKVNALSGFTYNWNEFASEQGGQFNPTKRFVGVSAQEVEKVLPEAVTAAPFNDEYLTVKYDKLVPLLIEAIKELSDKVSSLEDKLNN